MKRIYWVDIPNVNAKDTEEFINVATFNKRKDAVKFAQEHYGADKQGKIQLVTGGRE